MELALLFDIDGTLTPARRDLLPEMAEALKNLTVPFHVAAGSDMVLVEPQLLQPLYAFGFRKSFEAFISNGATRFHCDFSQGYDVQKISEFDFNSHLGPEDYAFFVGVIEEVLQAKEFALPDSVRIIGDRIINRRSMLNFAPIGRPKGQLTDEARHNRDKFVEFDKTTGYRRKILSHLNEKLAGVVREKGLRFMLGGETSFDIVIQGQDKTNAVRNLLAFGYQHVVFLGDALFEGGNDSVISDFVKSWTSKEPCPLTAIPVKGWQDTIQILRNRKWLS